MKSTSKTFIVTSALRLKLALQLAFVLAFALPAMTRAATFVWDADGATTTATGGTGSWDTSSSLWRSGGVFGTLGAWNNTPTDSTAILGGTAGTLTFGGSIAANQLLFSTTGYILSGAQTLTLTGTTPSISTASGVFTTSGNNTATVLAGSAGLTKLGSGTLNLNGSAVNTFTGGLGLKAGTLALDFANLATPTDLLNNGNALTLGGGALTVKSKGSGTTSQTFASTTANVGGGSILVNPNGGTSTTNVLNGLTASAAGSSLLVGTAASSGTGTVAFTTTTSTNAQNIFGGRVVFTSDGATNVNWATTASGSSPYTLSAYSSYSAMVAGATSDALNDRVTANLTFSGAHTHNSLKVENPAASQTLALGGNLLTLTSGGLLVTGPNAFSISGTAGATRLTAGAGSSYDLVVHNYCTSASATTISAVIGDNVVGNTHATSLTLAGPVQNQLTLSGVNTFTGPTYINAGRMQVGAANVLGNTSGIYVKNGGQLFLSATFNFVKNIEISGFGRSDGTLGSQVTQFGALRISTSQDVSGTVTLAGDARIGKHNGGAGTVSGQITGGYAIDFLGTSGANSIATTIALSNPGNNYTGDTSISHQDYNVTTPYTGGSMTLKLGASGVLPDGAGKGNIVFNGADANHLTILDLAGFSETVNGLSAAAATGAFIQNSIASTTSILTVGAGDTTSSFSGVIRNNAGTGGTLALAKTGTGTLTLNNTETYTGNTTISGGTLVLGSSGSVNSSASIQITNGASFDVSALGTYTLSGSTALRASGINGSPAKINAGTSIDLVSQAITLDFNPASTTGDITSPALAIANGNLNLNGQISINVGGVTPLGIGTYTILSNLNGTISGSPTFVTSGPGVNGIAANTTVSLDLNAPGQLNLVVQASPTLITLTRTVGSSPSTYGNTLNFHAALSPDPGDGTVVTFLTNGVAVGTATATGGIADLTTTTLAYSGGSTHIITATATGYASGLLSGGQQVNQYGLTITGAAAQDKFADGTTAAVITGGTLSTTVNGDTITANNGTFAQTNAGRGIAVLINLSGAEAGNYSLTQPVPGLTASIYTYPTWTNTLGGLWDTAGDWVASTIADGSGVTADFSQLDITADTTVSLSSPRNIGNLIFADTNTNSAAGWVLDNNAISANTLTLAGTTPTVTVSNLAAGKSVTISAEVDGTAGLAKAGAGTLVLSGTNNFTGTTTVSGGTLQIIGGSAIPDADSVNLTGAGVFDVESSETVASMSTSSTATNSETKLASGTILTMAGSVVSVSYFGRLTGMGGITYTGPANGAWNLYGTNNTYSGTTTINSGRLSLQTSAYVLSPNTTVVVTGDATGGGQFFDSVASDVISNNFTISGVGWPDSSGATRFGAIRVANGSLLGGSITLAGDSRLGVHSGISATVAGKITGPAAISFFATDGTNNNANVFTLANSGNDYAGNTTIENVDYPPGNVRTNSSTTIKLGASEVIPNGSGKGSLVFNGADGNHLTILELNGFSETVNGFSAASSSGAVVKNATTGTSILTIGDADTGGSFDGAITDGGAGSGKYLALTKIGSGTQTLSANNYQGNTTVKGGTLSLAQPTLSTNSTVSITNGAVLQLAFAGGETNTVAALVLNGANQPAGVYGNTTPGGYLAGSTGKLLVEPLVTINPNPPVLQVSYGAGSLSLAWPNNLGWILQSNSVSLRATNAWFNYPSNGLVAATNVTITVDPTKTSVFYRMVKP